MRIARRDFLCALPAAIAPWKGLASVQAQAGGERWATVERLCERFVAERRAPGISLAVSRSGTIVFSKGWGLANIEENLRVTPGTPFRIASVAKTFIGALFLRLTRSGKLSLDDPASRWLPGFPRSGEFTLRMLLNHTSGLGEYTKRPYEALVRDAQRDYSNGELVAYMAAIKPLFVHKPGTAWEYSNTGYVLLGVIAERAGGAPLSTLLEQHVLTPAGLRETTWDSDPAGAQGRAMGYGFRKGSWVRAPFVSTSYIGASGAIRSTARDLCRWYDALFGGRILARAELGAMMAPSRLADGRSTLRRSGSGYGLGLWTGRAGGRRVAWHAGSTSGFAADARHYPDDRVSIVMLGNADAGRMGSEPRRIREAVLKIVMAEQGL